MEQPRYNEKKKKETGLEEVRLCKNFTIETPLSVLNIEAEHSIIYIILHITSVQTRTGPIYVLLAV